jgi:1-deoxy-D-xylulose-5-phosphate reductoisomerase
VLNASNEVAVAAFLAGRCGFMQIPAAIEATLEALAHESGDTIEGLLAVDGKAREWTSAWLAQGASS